MANIMNRIEFTRYIDEGSYQQPVTLTFEVPQDMPLTTLHRLCRYFALCLGYTMKSVDEVFGEETYDDF